MAATETIAPTTPTTTVVPPTSPGEVAHRIVPNPTRPGARVNDGQNDYVVYYGDGYIDFTMQNGQEWSIGPNGEASVARRGQWVTVDPARIPAEVQRRFTELQAHAPADLRQAQSTPGSTPATPGRTPATPGTPPATPGTTPTTPGTTPTTPGGTPTDGIDLDAEGNPIGPGTPTTPDGVDPSRPGAPIDPSTVPPGMHLVSDTDWQDMQRWRTEVDNERRQRTEADQALQRNTAHEAAKPSFLQGLMEILEVVGRIFLPIISLISFIVRFIRIAGMLISGQEVPTHEWVRLAGDLVGSLPIIIGLATGGAGFLPTLFTVNAGWGFLAGAASAAVYEGANLFGGDSEEDGVRGGTHENLGGLFGRTNTYTDPRTGRQIEVPTRNPLREGAAAVYEWGRDTLGHVSDTVSPPSVPEGSAQDDGVAPVVLQPAEYTP